MHPTLRSRLTPWIYCPFLGLALPDWPGFESLFLSLHWLLLPLALHLGRRHGWKGAATIVIAGVMALAFALHDPSYWRLAPDTNWLVLCTVAALGAAGLIPWERVGTALRERPAAWLLVLLLPLGFGIHWSQDDATSDVIFIDPRLHFRVDSLFWLAIALAGWARVEWSRLLLPAIAAFGAWAAAKWMGGAPLAALFDADTVELPGLGRVPLDAWYVSYHLCGPIAVVLLVTCFGLGRWLARVTGSDRETAPPAGAMPAVIGLGILAGAQNFLPTLMDISGGNLRGLLGVNDNALWQFFAGWLTAPLVLFLAGLWRGRKMVIGLGLLLFAADIDWPSMPELDPARLALDALNWTFLSVALGGAGTWLHRRLGVTIPARGTGHFSHALLLLGSIWALIPESSRIEDEATALRLLAALALLAAVVVPLVWWRIRERHRPGRGWESDFEGWLALAALAGAAAALAENTAQLRALGTELAGYPEQFREMFREPGSETTGKAGYFVLRLGMVAVSLWLLGEALATAWVKWRASWRDARRAAARVARFFGAQRLAAGLDLPPPPPTPKAAPHEEMPGTGTVVWLRRGAWRAGRVVSVLAVVFVLFQFSVLWLEPEGDDASSGRNSGQGGDAMGTTSPPAARPPNPETLQAARSCLAETGHTIDLATGDGRLRSGWRMNDGDDRQRSRVFIRVGRDRSPYSLDVSVQIEERRHGLWFGAIRSRRDEENAAAAAMKAEILRRAGELAAAR